MPSANTPCRVADPVLNRSVVASGMLTAREISQTRESIAPENADIKMTAPGS